MDKAKNISNFLTFWPVIVKMVVLVGGGGSGKNDHKLRFWKNIELYERSLNAYQVPLKQNIVANAS